PAARRRDAGHGRGRSGAHAACGGRRRFGRRDAMISMDSALVFVVVIAAVIFIGSYAKILREYERGVIFRLGRNARALLNPGGTGNGPGLVLLAPFIDRMVKVSMQTVALDVPPQDIISRDNVSGKRIDLPQDMQRAMAKQAEAERERRAKVINAEGEFQAAAKLGEAAEVLTRFPVAVQLRYLQTMREIASERNTTTFFPLPMDLLGLFQTIRGKDGGETK